ncbi:MAG TPA: hypothetical protein VKA85_00400 [Candidatus Limnocylindrales bacterium]|nr:hypothetical protein [Candidatus Limnocylindrales bacterium]
MLFPPALLAAVLVVGLLALPPARRLFRSGRSVATIAVYYATLALLALLLVLVPGRGRFLIPVLVVLYVVPFITLPAGLTRLRRARVTRPPMKNVTPRDSAETREPR